ncbi:hypothetical protein H4582DRAFT_1821998 [Lactarius indigo]|nr:hypothetical protein H4582DRAFT_1821998 [Lactarius indigo]
MQIHIPCPYLGCRKKFIGHHGRTKHIRKVHHLRRIPTARQPTHASTTPTPSPPGSPQRSPSPSTTSHQQSPSPPIASPQPPSSPSSSAAADNNHPQVNHRCPTDINGIPLPEVTPPPARSDLPPDDWSPFKDAAHFLLADFLFRKAQMSASNITELFDFWALSVEKYDIVAPYDSHRTLYATIDAIQDGDAPWQCLSVNAASDDDPQHAPEWRREEYEVWYRDPDVVIRNLLDNPDFASQFDTAPYIMTDTQGEHRWTDFMSGQFAWRRSEMIYSGDPTMEGAMYCAVILGSDKTTVSVATGHVEYHPLYLSVGNLHNEARRGHRNGVIPIAFLAIPKAGRGFNDDDKFRKFKRQLYHSSISTILESLRPGMTTPVVRRCPDGHYRRVVYDIGPFIADYPEQVMLAGVVQGWCPRCTSQARDLDGAGGRRARVLTDLLVSSPEISSAELWDTYGIDDDVIPFTNDFPRADIHESLSPDLLHQIIKGSFKDHLVKWTCKYIVAIYTKSRAAEILDDIDRRIAMTPPFPGLRRFKHGRRFKQWMGDDSKALMKVYIPAIAEYVPPQLVQCLSAFLDFCYLVRCCEIGESDLTAIRKALRTFHATREIFRTSGVHPKGFNLPHQHSMVHYVHLIQEFGAPNGLCSSITESRHITAVKKLWRRSNRYEPLGQMLLTNQRLDKLLSAHVNFIARGMLSEERMPSPVTRPASNNDEDADGAIDGDIKGEVVLAVRPQSGYPTDLASLAEHIHTPNLPLLAQQFLFDQLNPDEPPAVQQPWAVLPNIQSKVLVFHSARAIFYAPSDVSGSHGMHRQIIRSTPSWRQKEARYDCVLIVEDQGQPGMRGMIVGRVRTFFSFTYNETVYPCALIDRFKRVGRGPDPVTGMWRVQPEFIGSRHAQCVVHIKTILRNVHLIPVFGSGSIPHQLHYSNSLDLFSMYYVNKYADHHSFEVVV